VDDRVVISDEQANSCVRHERGHWLEIR
jgi:hypothetical protein